MRVYRIARDKYANNLNASGLAGRWNADDNFVLYTSESRSLATLEVLVNSNRVGLLKSFKLMSIDLDVKSKEILTVKVEDLPKNWRGQGAYRALREIGVQWYQKGKHLALKVPSAVIPAESNYIINTKHPDFIKKVNLSQVESFVWDERLK